MTSVTLTTFKSVDNDDVLKQLDGTENDLVERKELKKEKVSMKNLKTQKTNSIVSMTNYMVKTKLLMTYQEKDSEFRK